MATIELKYGRQRLPFEYDSARFAVLSVGTEKRGLSDVEIGELLDQPIGTPTLDEIVSPGESVLIVVPDATRQTAAGQVVNLIVRRLIANGTPAHDIRIIFATGIHRRVTDEEKAAILTPFIFQRIKTLDHDPRDLARNIDMSTTGAAWPIEFNRALVEHDKVILVGGVSFHYFAGFTGGRKLVCPGLASSRTVSATHKLAFDCDTLDRRVGVETGCLDGNAVHEAFITAASAIEPDFCVTTIVNDQAEATDIFCGHWVESHRAACDHFAAERTLLIKEKRGLVIVSAGGHPHDLNMIQAHKALDAASQACLPGGTIVLLAECVDGLGRDDFLKWFEEPTSEKLAIRLCEKYQVNGQTAWSFLKKAEKFEVRVMTTLDARALSAMRCSPANVADVSDLLNRPDTTGYIIPAGSDQMIRTA